ncbi:MAG: hypothetical protein U0941_04810 [Planctomycetaceae bacterium]
MVNIVRYIVAGIFIIITLCSLLMSWGTTQANKQVDEANTASQSANALVGEFVPKYQELFKEANLQGFPGNREDLKPIALEGKEKLTKAAEQFRLAATKLEEAAGRPVSKPLSEYWGLKVKSYRKLAESKEKFVQVVELFLDESITTLDILDGKLGPLIEEATKLNTESDAFDAEAKKIQDANPKEFK